MKGTLGKILSKRFLLHSFLPAVLFVVLNAAFVNASGGGGEAAGDHGNYKLIEFGWRIVNVGILAGFLYWVSAKGIRGFFGGRRESIKNAMEEAIAAKEDAQKKYEEYSAKIEKATGEIEEITSMIKSQGEAEKEKIIEDAKRAAAKTKVDSQARMEQEFAKMKTELRVEAARLAVEMAETILKKQIKKVDHEGMVKDFLDRMVKLN